jgi:hypothetical protein
MGLAGHVVGANRALANSNNDRSGSRGDDGARAKNGGVMIHGPGDIEGHCGGDGRYYVLDFGRTFPPEYPNLDLEIDYSAASADATDGRSMGSPP